MAPYEIIGDFAVKFLGSEVLIITTLPDSTLFALAEITRRVGNLLRVSKVADVRFQGSRRLGFFYHIQDTPRERIRELFT